MWTKKTRPDMFFAWCLKQMNRSRVIEGDIPVMSEQERRDPRTGVISTVMVQTGIRRGTKTTTAMKRRDVHALAMGR